MIRQTGPSTFFITFTSIEKIMGSSHKNLTYLVCYKIKYFKES
jgi:hypothetical protein